MVVKSTISIFFVSSNVANVPDFAGNDNLYVVAPSSAFCSVIPVLK